ncbi:MAG: pyridoxamine 5'-phosphate oxidase family protein [Deltaproteobacteria bacterium]|nr:pyridoxamine 5'-phosphate oxidase family protein [Deltaproteobacteria bacterium]
MNEKTPTPGESQQRSLALQLVKEQYTLTLCTATQNNPWAAPVYFVNLDFQFYFFSDPASRHIQESQANSTASAAIFHQSNSWKEIRGVQMSGKIERLRPGLESLRALRAYLKKFPFTKEFFDSGDKPDLEGFSKRFRVRLYCFRPDLLYYLDNRIRFGFREKIRI